MHAIAHRFDHLPHGLLALTRLVAFGIFRALAAAFMLLMARNAARRDGNDDIYWDDGEPEHTADKP